MLGPGEYVADETQGITRVEDLPRQKLIRRSRNYKRWPCPLCKHSAYRLRTVTRTLRDLGDPLGQTTRYHSHVSGTTLPSMQPLLQHRHGRFGPAQKPLYTQGGLNGGTTGRRRWIAVPTGIMAFMARPSSVCSMGYNSELD